MVSFQKAFSWGKLILKTILLSKIRKRYFFLSLALPTLQRLSLSRMSFLNYFYRNDIFNYFCYYPIYILRCLQEINYILLSLLIRDLFWRIIYLSFCFSYNFFSFDIIHFKYSAYLSAFYRNVQNFCFSFLNCFCLLLFNFLFIYML